MRKSSVSSQIDRVRLMKSSIKGKQNSQDSASGSKIENGSILPIHLKSISPSANTKSFFEQSKHAQRQKSSNNKPLDKRNNQFNQQKPISFSLSNNKRFIQSNQQHENKQNIDSSNNPSPFLQRRSTTRHGHEFQQKSHQRRNQGQNNVSESSNIFRESLRNSRNEESRLANQNPNQGPQETQRIPNPLIRQQNSGLRDVFKRQFQNNFEVNFSRSCSPINLIKQNKSGQEQQQIRNVYQNNPFSSNPQRNLILSQHQYHDRAQIPQKEEINLAISNDNRSNIPQKQVNQQCNQQNNHFNNNNYTQNNGLLLENLNNKGNQIQVSSNQQNIFSQQNQSNKNQLIYFNNDQSHTQNYTAQTPNTSILLLNNKSNNVGYINPLPTFHIPIFQNSNQNFSNPLCLLPYPEESKNISTKPNPQQPINLPYLMACHIQTQKQLVKICLETFYPQHNFSYNNTHQNQNHFPLPLPLFKQQTPFDKLYRQHEERRKNGMLDYHQTEQDRQNQYYVNHRNPKIIIHQVEDIHEFYKSNKRIPPMSRNNQYRSSDSKVVYSYNNTQKKRTNQKIYHSNKRVNSSNQKSNKLVSNGKVKNQKLMTIVEERVGGFQDQNKERQVRTNCEGLRRQGSQRQENEFCFELKFDNQDKTRPKEETTINFQQRQFSNYVPTKQNQIPLTFSNFVRYFINDSTIQTFLGFCLIALILYSGTLI